MSPTSGLVAVNGDRATRIWTEIALRARRDATTVSPQLACLACVEAIAGSGAGLVLATSLKTWEPAYTTDSRAEKVEALQATLGQGPGMTALMSGRPVLVDHLASPANAGRWPVFAPEAHRLGVHAMYSLPLGLGAIRVGVLDLYGDTPAELSRDQLVDALIYADTALLLALDSRSGIATPLDGGSSAERGTALWHAEVHQAAGMVSIQLGISVLDALVRLRAHAYSHNQGLTDVARFVVERRLRFHPDDVNPATDPDREGQP